MVIVFLGVDIHDELTQTLEPIEPIEKQHAADRIPADREIEQAELGHVLGHVAVEENVRVQVDALVDVMRCQEVSQDEPPLKTQPLEFPRMRAVMLVDTFESRGARKVIADLVVLDARML